MKPHLILSFALSAMLSSCALTPYHEESKLTVGQAVIGALDGLKEAADYVHTNHVNTYGLRPTKATVTLSLTTMRTQENTAQLAASLPNGASGGFGWKADKSIQKGSTLEIEFTPGAVITFPAPGRFPRAFTGRSRSSPQTFPDAARAATSGIFLYASSTRIQIQFIPCQKNS